jgi:hypothetical protein
LIVNLKDAGNSQGYSLYHVSGDHCFAAMSLASGRWKGQRLVSGHSSGYVYIFADDGSDLLAAERVYAKSDAPGKLVIYGRSARPRSVSLVDISPLGIKPLGSLAWLPGAEGVEITIDPTSETYWVQVDW